MSRRSLLSHVSGESIVGGEEIVGLSAGQLTSIIGAATQSALEQVALTRAAGGVALMPTQDQFKVKGMPFTPALAVAAAATVTVSTPTAQEKFRPERLVIQGASNWVVTGIKVTTKEQLIATGPMPGELFSFDAWGVYVEFTTLPIGGVASITATNVSANPANLYAGFLGSAVG